MEPRVRPGGLDDVQPAATGMGIGGGNDRARRFYEHKDWWPDGAVTRIAH